MLIRHERNRGSMSNVMLSIMAKENTNMDTRITTVMPLASAKVNGTIKTKAVEESAEIIAAKARIAELEAKLAAASQPKALSMKVSEKRGASLYGLGRFPVTLYYGQWVRLIAKIDEIKAWLEANKAGLSMEKGDKE